MKFIKNFLVFLVFTSFLTFPVHGTDLKQQNLHVQAQSLLVIEKCTRKKSRFKYFLKKIVTAPKYSGYALRLFFDKYGRPNF